MGLDMTKLPGTNTTELNEILKAIPPSPLISEEDWKELKEYYLLRAPDSLQALQEEETPLVEQFGAFPLSLPIDGKNMLTMVRWDAAHQKILIGTRKGKLYQFHPGFTLEDSFQLGSPPSDIFFSSDENAIVSRMGIMDPNDLAAGSVIRISHNDDESLMLFDSIKRPVDIEGGDLNNDGEEDLIVAAFGNFTGALYAYERTAAGYKRHNLHHFPGTRKSIVRDFNADGLADILALITQGDERLALFTNRGNFKFSYQVLVKFPPVYGSSYFELHDFNSDGHPDILYTNGDNADYSNILKPYHGIRIFLNDGENHFNESWFYPMHGASMAHAEDFDRDGDLDIAAISFFPDFENHPERGFIYLENDAGKFMASCTPLASSARWITMEAADVDLDGDTDIILGALAFPTKVPDSLFQTWGKNKISLLLLKNNLVEMD